MKYLPFSQTKIASSFLGLPARISPKEISGANGKFLPKPQYERNLYWGFAFL